jgi:ubiquinone/menaquinone biosynthesis C-methylase UbiE
MSNWTYDEFKHIGLDFDDPHQMQTYDARQQTDLSRERTLVQRLGIASDDLVIEFGCGTGAFALAAAEAGAKVTAVDISAAMLNYARAKAAESGLDSIHFVRGSFLMYEHHGRHANFVVSKFALHHLPDFWKAAALLQIHELLKAGGIFYLQDVVYSFEPAEQDFYLEQWIQSVASESGSGFSRADFEMHIRDEYSTFGWILEGLIQRAGFQITSAEYYAPTYASYRCTR